MTITSQNQLVNSGSFIQSWYQPGQGVAVASAIFPTVPLFVNSGGYPAQFGYTPAVLTGAIVDGTTNTQGGAFPYINPTSGVNYLASVTLSVSALVGGVSIFDFIWYNTGLSLTTTTAQTVNSVPLPARDANGSFAGVGVTAWLYIKVVLGNSAAISNTTISYTNSNGVSGRTGATIAPIPATAPAGLFIPFSLQAGDVGVQSIQSITLGTSYVSGIINLMMIREVAFFGMPVSTSCVYDWAQTGMPVLYNGTALSYYTFVRTSGTGVDVCGQIKIVNG